MNRQLSFVTGVFTGIFTVIGACGQARNPMDSRPIPSPPGFFGPVSARLRAGDVAPDLVFTRVLQPPGATSWNSGLAGKTTVLAFFPLISRNPEVMRTWNAIVRRFAAKPMQFVMITSEKESTLLPWLAQHPLSGSVLYDTEGRTGRAYGLEMPDAVYIGADGKIIGFDRGFVPNERTLNALLEGRITTTRPSNDVASVEAFLASGLVPLEAEPPRMPRPQDNRPDFPPSHLLHVSPAKGEMGSSNSSGDGFWNLQGFTLKNLVAEIYEVSPNRIVLPATLDDGKRYDFALVLPEPRGREEMRPLMKQAIEDRFHIAANRESRLSNVYLVNAPNGAPPKTTVRRPADRAGFGMQSSSMMGFRTAGGTDDVMGEMKPRSIDAIDSISIRNATISEFCKTLESMLGRPVINATNLKGRYDLQVSAERGDQNDFLQILRSKLNLVVTPAQRNIDALVFLPR